ncbi:hypothetical protein H7J08_05550 [Mycobacterium frederiksbergense]|nr:hypothetical protein [Mycolicibacterium frederiksbergense]MCV7044137.1 hypothetical protein [Mycolicibacterium frederiksbergense]
MNRSNVRAARLAAGALIAGLALTGCSAGQVSQSANQEPAVNGTVGTVGDIALRNVFLRAPQTTDYVQPGTDAELIFAAANNSADVDDKLVSVTSDVGTVTLTGDGEIPASGLLLVGDPDGHDALGTIEREDDVDAQVTLTEPISNGLMYDFTFTFERAGSTTVAVPISAGEVARRDGEPVVGGGHDTGGH